MDFGLILYFPLFLLASYLAFYIPGNSFVASLPITKLQKITLSMSFGIVLWALQGFLFGYLHIRWMTYVYLIVLTIMWFRKCGKTILSPHLLLPKPNRDALLLGLFIAIAVLSQTITTFANGITTSKGIYFCCGLPDSLFHIALTNNMIYTFPPHEPGVSGQILHNYHFLSNLANADIIRVFHLPLLLVQYPYMSILINVLFALNILTFAQLVIKKKTYIYWLLFFVFFSGDILYLLIFILTHTINFNASFLGNASELWFSPPRVYGAMLTFTGMNSLLLWTREKKNKYLDMLLIGTFGSLIGFKVYSGIFALTGLAALLFLFLKEKDRHKVIVIFLTFLMSIGLYLPVNSSAGGFIFTGFWRFENFAANPVFGLHSMELARSIYLNHGNWMHALLNDLIYFILYFVFIFGTLLFALFQTRESIKLFNKELHIFLLTGLTINFILGSFFLQQTGGSNSSQFLITDMIMISVYTALAISYWFAKIKHPIVITIVTIIIVLFTIPRVFYENYKFLYTTIHQEGFLVTKNQLAALDYLNKNTPADAIILQNNLDNCLQITFIAQRQIYICIDASPGDHGEQLDNRLKLQQSIFQSDNKKAAQAIAELPHEHIVNYLYLSTDSYYQRRKIYNQYGYTKKFSNDEVTILQVE